MVNYNLKEKEPHSRSAAKLTIQTSNQAFRTVAQGKSLSIKTK